MTNHLAILSEDDSDDLFYERCAERITGKSFALSPIRITRGGGISEVRKTLRPFLNSLKPLSKYPGDTYFIVALDNDRAPVHPDHIHIPGINRRDKSKPCRVCELKKEIYKVLGADESKWPAKGAIAVPVQMLESWILLGLNEECNEERLPIFPRKSKSAAKQFHNGSPPDQLKDLIKIERENLDLASNDEVILHAADNLDLESLKSRSPSFEHFAAQLDDWK